MSEKKLYQKPVLTKVRLEVRNAVLAACRTSGIATPLDVCQRQPTCAFF